MSLAESDMNIANGTIHKHKKKNASTYSKESEEIYHSIRLSNIKLHSEYIVDVAWY